MLYVLSSKSVPISPEEENQDLIALDLQRRLIEIAESQQLYDEIETARREEESLYDVELRVMESSKPDNDDYDHYDDRMSEFSFYKFSLQHFQGFVSHTHISQRLRQPLLKHDDEGDALVRRRRPMRGVIFLDKITDGFHLVYCRRV